MLTVLSARRVGQINVMFAQLASSTTKCKISVKIVMTLLLQLFVPDAQLRTSALNVIQDSIWVLRALSMKEFAKVVTIKTVLNATNNQESALSVSPAST